MFYSHPHSPHPCRTWHSGANVYRAALFNMHAFSSGQTERESMSNEERQKIPSPFSPHPWRPSTARPTHPATAADPTCSREKSWSLIFRMDLWSLELIYELWCSIPFPSSTTSLFWEQMAPASVNQARFRFHDAYAMRLELFHLIRSADSSAKI